jgi:prepilin-type N-terminal cleavage/methylation domain-containing protein
MRPVGERGETLIEVLIAIVLIGAISSAYFLTASTQTRASALNKELVQADAVARSYAELAKAKVRDGCDGLPVGSHFTVDPSTFPPNYGTSTLDQQNNETELCPSTTAPQLVQLTVTTPSSETAHLSFAVLAP